jgi:hypothetical protein
MHPMMDDSIQDQQERLLDISIRVDAIYPRGPSRLDRLMRISFDVCTGVDRAQERGDGYLDAQ